jgi:hypothetical protein
MYTYRNFKTKKELKEAVKAYVEGKGPPISYYQPGPFGGNEPLDGIIYLEGPHYPKPHRWYAQAEVRDGAIVKVK